MNYIAGEQWKTRGGWKAVVLETDGFTAKVWHNRNGGDSIVNHSTSVESSIHGLVEPWIEPESITIDEKLYIWKEDETYIVSLEPSFLAPFAVVPVMGKIKKGDGI